MIDSHCHLDFSQFDNQREKAILQARQAGVNTIINIGTDLSSSTKSIELAITHENLYATVGVHPHDARTVNDDVLKKLEELTDHPRVVGIGEIGLDFYRDHSPRNVQRQVFQKQLELAVRTGLPVVIHTRQAFEETVAIIGDYAGELKGGVFHCFPGNVDEAQIVFDLGFVISVGGIITFKDSGMSKMAAEVPLDKIILETDAPYLAPVPHRGKMNYPAYVVYVYEKLAQLKSIPVSKVEKVTDRTCQKLFGLVEIFGD
jgi:TatD DNase family protein